MNTNEEAELLLIDKPLRWTSFDVVKKIKHTGKYKKIGHAGTLDPLATGLLILCTGKKTKEIDSYQAQEKEYTGTFVLGKTTPSVDLETQFDAEYPTEHLDNEKLIEATKHFIGLIQQVPPAHSAVKIDGKRAYEYARADQEVIIKTRTIEIKEFEIETNNFPEIAFRIVCSKGTYIRSLVRDFGFYVGSGAYLSSLCRTRIGNFKIEEAKTVQQYIQEKKFIMNPVFQQVAEQLEDQNLSIVSSDFARPWGGFFVIDENLIKEFAAIYFPELVNELPENQKFSPKILVVAPEKRLSWQYHFRRAEVWRVVEGPVAVAKSDTDEQQAPEIYQNNEKITLKQGERHRLIGLENWGVVAEIWQHTDSENPSDEDDIVRLQDDFKR
jgi:tRNA pseudouridine55 synthase